MRFLLATLALVGACCAPPASATTYVVPPDAFLFDQADGVVVGEVLGEAPSPLADHAVYVLRTDSVVAGAGALPYEQVMLPRAGLRADHGAWSYGTPMLAPGMRVLIPYERRTDGILLPLHLGLGVFHRVGSAERAWYVRDLDGSGEIAKASKREHWPRDALRFEAWIARRARGYVEAPDYFVARALPFARPKFNLSTGGNGLPIRWNAFDASTTVTWTGLASGQPGMIADEGTMITQALAAWTNDPGSRILLAYGGTVANVDTHCDNGSSDGNLVLWNDPLNTIGGSFSCSSGGVLANAGPCFFEGTPFNQAFEGRMTVQNGSECFFDQFAGGTNGAEVLTHEFGHTLGFSHSCEEGECVVGTAADNATMRWDAHGDNRGAVLAPDDVAAAFALYPGAGGGQPDTIFLHGFE